MEQRRSQSSGRDHDDPARVYQPNPQPPRELFLRVRISTIEKAKKDLLVRFDAITNLPHFPAANYPGIVRPYRELCLYALALSLSTPATIVPALPLPSTTASGLQDTRILRIMLARWFHRVLAEPHLRDHPETRSLIEADFAYSPTTPGAGSSAAARKRFSNAMASAAAVAYGGVDATGALPNGVLATSASAGSRISSGGLGLLGLGSSSKGMATSRSVYDDDEELVAARAEVTRLEMQFADAAEASEKLAHARRSLTSALTDLSIKFNNLGAVEEVRPASARLGLPYVLKRSAYMTRSIGELQESLSSTELLTMGDAVAYQSINARAAKETMLARNAMVEEHHNAQKQTVAKKRDAEHLRMQRNLRADRVDDALEELEEAKRHEHALALNLKKISAELHGSLQSHSRYAHQDLQQALVEHARGSIMYARQTMREMAALKADLEGRPPPARAAVAMDDERAMPFAEGMSRSSSAATRPSVEAAAPPTSPPRAAASAPTSPPPPQPLPGTPQRTRPNPWSHTSHPPHTTQSASSSPASQARHLAPSQPASPAPSEGVTQSLFLPPSSPAPPGPPAFGSRSTLLNSGFSSGTAGRSRISASEAARSLAGTF